VSLTFAVFTPLVRAGFETDFFAVVPIIHLFLRRSSSGYRPDNYRDYKCRII
jgi:hypothetical protein